MSKSNPAERAFETLLFASRWLMAPFYFGLVVALVALLYVFGHETLAATLKLAELKETDIIVWVLSLIDLSLMANLLLMVIFSGYENFVSKMDVAEHPDRPAWMGKIDFSGMKLKLIASIVAISAIHLLRAFMEVESMDKTNLQWMVIIHLAFVTSGVLLALMDWITSRSDAHG
ncbi:MAG: TIGR00645 family protein [Alphaproteobacteria bacterium]|nr:TIGR00645 family protein [Alphaproteobacteria bacterium]MBU6471499.1 TIGR00645 family protein [Alphaproteobacteria bacterium]MDE2012262.1 TIGR00645 family protein [Alphaproteobacteria bacterium]MDE2072829.1 TIGR00645 family protein [Alphaproteobacteria bacterium]MDE2352699.1 TIGR00645 family protein [Alphaproteobacteria bacterium]